MVRLSLAAVLFVAAACQSNRAAEGDFGELEDEVAELREEHDSEVAELRTDLRDLRGELRDLRAELRDLREITGAGGALFANADEGGRPAGEAEAESDASEEPAKKPAPGEPAKQEKVRIAVSSNPRGATVFLGSKKLGVTPLLLQREPDAEEIHLRLEKPGYRARLMTVRPEEDTKISVQLAKK